MHRPTKESRHITLSSRNVKRRLTVVFLTYISSDVPSENLPCNEAAAFRVRSFQAQALVSARVMALQLASVINIS
ncbi:uncharacterized [Tachysurus ichikawai]